MRLTIPHPRAGLGFAGNADRIVKILRNAVLLIV
jgi:hypothetical protein